jgi:hypothetical protein
VKRVGHVLERVTAFAALRAAYRRAARGKGGRVSAERFAYDLEPELLRLQDELRAGTWRPGPTVQFVIHDPKRRVITVAPFRDRVVHHALVAAIAPTLERGMDADSYGCRVGKGTDRALARAQELARRAPWALRSDVQAFFASVPHAPLLTQLARLFKDQALLDLLARIVRAGGGHNGRGLPIGHLTSQWLANLYLTLLDREVRALPGVRGYVRYMDDLILFGDRGALLTARGHLPELLAGLGLTLNRRVTQLHRCRGGFPFLGFRVRAGAPLRLRRASWRRTRAHLRTRERAFRRGQLDEAGLQACAVSALAHTDRAASQGLRRAALAREPPVVW